MARQATALPWPAENGPYNPNKIRERIAARMVELGMEPKHIYDTPGDPVLKANGLGHKGSWSEKMNGPHFFTHIQLSRLFVVLRGWPGFPYVDAPKGRSGR